MSDQFFLKAIVISLTIHLFFAGSSLFWRHKEFKKNQPRRVEITYKAVRGRKHPDIVSQRAIKPVQNLDLRNTNMLLAQDGFIPIKLTRNESKKPMNVPIYERPSERITIINTKRVVSIPEMQSEKMNNPAYAAYSQMVRERIKKKVYQNYSQLESGSVYLTFVVGSDGGIKASQIIEDKTVATQRLKEISLRSLKDAGPFSAFPKGMNLPEYTFNIEIQYQVSE